MFLCNPVIGEDSARVCLTIQRTEPHFAFFNYYKNASMKSTVAVIIFKDIPEKL